MLIQLPDFLSRESLLAAIRNIDDGIAEKYKESTDYDVVYKGGRYSPKEVVGEAVYIQEGVRIKKSSFKGGKETKCFRLIREAGIEIKPKEKAGNNEWSSDELEAAVLVYIEVQRKIRSGEKVVKAHYLRELSSKFGRSTGAFDYRMQNISYVLSVAGREWVKGWRPARNVGVRVAAEIGEILSNLQGFSYSESLLFDLDVNQALAKEVVPKPEGVSKPDKTKVEVESFKRDPAVKAWVLDNANGVCESCGCESPFVSSSGKPFLEVHHVHHLSDGGADAISNAVGVCPNCHREFHYGVNAPDKLTEIYEKLDRLVTG